MMTETRLVQQISEPNQILHITPDTRELVRPDFELAVKGGTIVLEINADVFMSLGIKDENMKMIKKAIEDSDNDWFECLEKANGDYEKALELYGKY